MTIGQRIAQKRKEQGLSQETLGEMLGVSRQSVYKWESDSALPEVDKLVALSRLFGVTVGWLLGVEEPEAGNSAEAAEPAAGDLTGEQLKLVEEIVSRYLASQPPAEKPPVGKWDVRILFALCGILLAVILGVNSKVGRLDSQYGSLQNTVSYVRSDVNSQISGIAGRVEEILKHQNSLTADYGLTLVSADLAANTVTLSASATPKTYVEGMETVFLADTGSGPVEYPGQLGPGRAFSAEITCPLSDSITVSAVFLDGEKGETQLLYTYSGLYTGSMPVVYMEGGELLFWQEVDAAGKLYFAEEYVWLCEDKFAQQAAFNAQVPVAAIAKVRVGLFCNRELVSWLEPCPQPDSFHGFEGKSFYRLADVKVTLSKEDILILAAVVTDEYSREIVCPDAPCSIQEDGDQRMLVPVSGDITGWQDPSGWVF